MNEDGEVKEDCNLAMGPDGIVGRWDAVGAEVVRRFQAGEELTVIVFSVMGRDVVSEIK